MLSVEKTLKQEIEQWKHEYEVLDACCELAQSKIAELKAENDRLKEELEPYKHPDVITLLTNWRTGELDRTHNKIANERDKYRQTLQEIKGVVTALYMNNWLQMNETARKSIQLLQDLITKAEEEWK